MKRNVMGVVAVIVLFAAVVCICNSSASLSRGTRNVTPGTGLSPDAIETGIPDVLFGRDAQDAAESIAESAKAAQSNKNDTVTEPDSEASSDTNDPFPGDGVPFFSLSKKGKNVVVLLIDRALGEDFPYLLKERPSLKRTYDGFTYYSNVISFGGHTNAGAPPVMGGYEYTPIEMNKRGGELLVTKHNESMKVMPVLFSQHGFNVTVCDAPYGNYKWVTDLSVYADHPEIRAFMTTGYFKSENAGGYGGVSRDFINAYEALKNLTTMTYVRDDASDNFLLFYNDTPHQPVRFKEPDYVPMSYADNSAYDAAHTDRFTIGDRTLRVTTENRMDHYQTNMATMIEIGKWLDFLRKNEVYDNTKIIIVADHGYYLHQLSDLDFPEHRLTQGDYVDIGNYFPLLLVKDFDSHGYTTSSEFMTNADVPTIACEGVIEDPVNPFTNKPINSEEKTAHDQFIITNHEGWSTATNNGYRFSAGTWAAVTSDIWDREDWRFIDYFTVLTDHRMPGEKEDPPEEPSYQKDRNEKDQNGKIRPEPN